MSEPPIPGRPLVVTSDDDFAESARRWCAAAGGDAQSPDGLDRLRQAWRTAPAVIVDARRLDLVARHDLPRRDGVLVVATDPRDVWRAALDAGACDVLTAGDDGAVVEALVSALDGTGEACMVSVVGACGGVGASTLAVASARLATDRGLRAVLVDGDAAGGGLDLLAGAEHVPGPRWGDLDGAIGQVAAHELAAALPVHDGLALMSFGRDGAAVRTATPVVSAAVRGYDLVVADVPRHLDDLARELVTRSLLTVIVVPRRLGGVVAARTLAGRLEGTGSVALVTRACRGGVPSAVIGREVGLPVLADIGHSRRLAVDLEHGLGPLRARPVARAARRILDTVGLR